MRPTDVGPRHDDDNPHDGESHQDVPADFLQLYILHASNDITRTDLLRISDNLATEMLYVRRRWTVSGEPWRDL